MNTGSKPACCESDSANNLPAMPKVPVQLKPSHHAAMISGVMPAQPVNTVKITRLLCPRSVVSLLRTAHGGHSPALCALIERVVERIGDNAEDKLETRPRLGGSAPEPEAQSKREEQSSPTACLSSTALRVPRRACSPTFVWTSECSWKNVQAIVSDDSDRVALTGDMGAVLALHGPGIPDATFGGPPAGTSAVNLVHDSHATGAVAGLGENGVAAKKVLHVVSVPGLWSPFWYAPQYTYSPVHCTCLHRCNKTVWLICEEERFMNRSLNTQLPVESELHHFLDRALFRMESATLLVLLLISLLQPTVGRTGLPTWGLLCGFLLYNVGLQWVRRRNPALQSFRHKFLLSLLVTAFVYFLGPAPGGLLFVLFFLDVACGVASLMLRDSLIHIGATMAVTAIIDWTFLQWSWTTVDYYDLLARLVMLALFGVSTAILRRRLHLEHVTARSVRDQAEQLEALDRLRADFIASVSHELRTPLTAARAAVVLLQASAGDRLRPDEQGLMDNARRNIEHLGRLIDDLLTHNQLESGMLQLDWRPCDLRAIVTDAIATVYPLIQEKGQVLEVALPEPLPLAGDAQRLEQVVVNLLANAYRHTPPGTRISVSGWVEDADVRLAVRDNGSGIAPAELERIFERFVRVDRDEPGSGLGLAIARNLVNLHGGRVWAESRVGAGTTVCVALPRASRGGKA